MGCLRKPFPRVARALVEDGPASAGDHASRGRAAAERASERIVKVCLLVRDRL